MFILNVAFNTGLVALGFGAAFLVWGYRNQGKGIALAKVAGYVISILAIIGMLCTVIHGTRYWKHGYYKMHQGSSWTVKKHMMEKNTKPMERMHKP